MNAREALQPGTPTKIYFSIEKNAARRLVFPHRLWLNPPAKKEGPLESGPSLGRKRPRRAYGEDSPQTHHIVRREDFNGKTADAATNGVGVSFLHQILQRFCGDFGIFVQIFIDDAELAISSFCCARC